MIGEDSFFKSAACPGGILPVAQLDGRDSRSWQPAPCAEERVSWAGGDSRRNGGVARHPVFGPGAPRRCSVFRQEALTLAVVTTLPTKAPAGQIVSPMESCTGYGWP